MKEARQVWVAVSYVLRDGGVASGRCCDGGSRVIASVSGIEISNGTSQMLSCSDDDDAPPHSRCHYAHHTTTRYSLGNSSSPSLSSLLRCLVLPYQEEASYTLDGT